MTLADTLAGRHQVELVSIFRHREKPQLGRSPEVPLRALARGAVRRGRRKLGWVG